MHQPHGLNAGLARAVLASVWGLICALIVAAPFLAAHTFDRAAAILYFFFSPVCHQNPERSFLLFGHSLAVCHRCSGIYIGLFLGCFFENRSMHRGVRTRRYWILAAAAPMLFDLLAPVAGLWSNTAFTRFSTGLLFGTVLSSLLVRGFSEFMQEAPGQRLPMQTSQFFKGDLS